MAHLETGSTPVQQRARFRAACQMIKDKCRNKSGKKQKSYSITSDDISGADESLAFFEGRKYGRG